MAELKEDLSFGIDVREDQAFFMDRKHILNDGWSLDDEAKFAIGDNLHFFRLVDENGVQQHGHGWIEKGKIVQWG